MEWFAIVCVLSKRARSRGRRYINTLQLSAKTTKDFPRNWKFLAGMLHHDGHPPVHALAPRGCPPAQQSRNSLSPHTAAAAAAQDSGQCPQQFKAADCIPQHSSLSNSCPASPMSVPGSAVNSDSGLHLCNAAAAELKQLIRSGILCAAPHATDR